MIEDVKRFAYIFFFSLLFVSCEKEKFKEGEKRLPKATEKGRGIFACYIGPDTYIGKGQEAITYNETTGYLYLENVNPFYRFRLFVYEGLFAEGTYAFDITGEEIERGNEFYGIDSTGLNYLEITKLDLDEKIISGTFELDLENEQQNELLIRDGRFDLTLNIID